MTTFYVCATDRFMSGWGKARGKINKKVLICDSWEEAEIVADNLRARNEMRHVNINTKRPNYPESRYIVSWGNKAERPTWYQKGYMRSRAS